MYAYQYFLQPPFKDFYTRNNYEIKCAFAGEITKNLNFITRMVNTFVFLINNNMALPKIIVVMMEQDVVRYLENRQIETREAMKRWFSKMINEFRKATSTAKDILPNKSKKHGWPHILWLIPILHEGFRNFQFTNEVGYALEDAVITQQHMSALRLKQLWDSSDHSLYLEEYGRYTSNGLKCIWEAADRTVKFCDKAIFANDSTITNATSRGVKNKEKQRTYDRNSNNFRSRHRTHQDRHHNDRYHWNRNNERDRFRKLPSPPRHR